MKNYADMIPVYFASPFEFREWLEKNHEHAREVLVGYFKKGSGRPSMTWSQSVDQALCFGWIDGIRKSVDKERYCIRFTPRKKTSTWSSVNIAKVEALIMQGLMRPPGLEAYRNRKVEKSGIYSFEAKPRVLPDNYAAIFQSNGKAWEFFTKQAPSYQRMVIFWILSAKQETTQHSRLQKAIAVSDQEKRM